MNRRDFVGAVSLSTLATAVQAEAWPAKPIRIVVPFAPGGGIDILCRALSEELTRRWKQPIIVDNKAGAASIIGADAVAKAPPDGYTLLATVNQTLVGNRFLHKTLPYDPDKSFTPISMMVMSDQMILANPMVAASSLKELVALAKKDPAALTYGSFGNGSQPHLLFETIKAREGIDILHVPYKGIAPALAAVVAGEVSLGLASVAVAGPLIAGGKIKPIAVTGPNRLQQYPKVSTAVETGFPYAQTSIWYALFAPTGTPPAIVNRIANDVRAILNDPRFAESQITSKGLTAVAGDGKHLIRAIKDETEVVRGQIKAANVQPE